MFGPLKPPRNIHVVDPYDLFEEQIEISDQVSSRPADAVIIEGYATRWNEYDLDRQAFARGAFTESFHASQGARGVLMHAQHEEVRPIGRWTTIREDAVGLFVRGSIYPRLASKALVRDVKALKINGLSVGTYNMEWGDGFRRRLITKAWLTEISVGVGPKLVSSTFSIVKR